MIRSGLRIVAVTLALAASGCNLDLGAGDPRGSNGTVSGATVENFDGSIPHAGGGSTPGGGDPCFVPCNGGYDSQCGWICGSGGGF